MKRLIAIGAVVLATPVWFAACGGSGREASIVNPGPDGSTAQSGAGGASGAISSGGSSGSIGLGGGFGSSGAPTLDDACAATTQSAKLVPLDIYVMLDISASMLDPTGAAGTGVTKWAAVSTALEQFVSDPKSAGLGVGIQYFPLDDPAVPPTCRSSAQCGAFAPCFQNFCLNAGPGFFPCDVVADCVAGDGTDLGPCAPLRLCMSQLAQGAVTLCHADFECGRLNDCVPFGECSLNINFLCPLPAPNSPPVSCGNDPMTGTPLGNCRVPTSVCVRTASCNAAQYAMPAVAIATLPAAAAGLTASIAGQTPAGQTPTAPALAGALQQARAWAASHPDHTVIALLATDGLPTECIADPVGDPTGITGVRTVAMQGLAASPSVSTFVIGVFGATDVGARQNLDQIALAGGSQSAFIVDPAQDVTAQFLSALDRIRGSKLGCEFQLPDPPLGDSLDFGLVNVVFNDGTNKRALYYVGADASRCDPATGGWYYDQDPAVAAPTKIQICPASCDAVQAAANGSVEIALGCVAIVP